MFGDKESVRAEERRNKTKKRKEEKKKELPPSIFYPGVPESLM